MLHLGTIQSWNDDRGFGFIAPSKGGEAVFFHILAFDAGGPRPRLGEPVRFEVEKGPQGKPRARRVAPIRASKIRRPPRRPSGRGNLWLIPCFVAIYLAVLVMWRAPPWVGLVYVGMSLLTFLMYWSDKSAAMREARRTPETTLHLLSLFCGWPGALLAQYFLRHKSSKPSFRAQFWITLVLNVALFVWIFSPMGRQFWPVLH